MYRPPVKPSPPDLLPHRERLYLSPANPTTADALLKIFYRLGLIVEEPHDGVLLIQLQADHVEGLADSLAGELTAEQRRETKCRLSDAGHAPSLAELMRSQTLDAFAASLRYRWLNTLLRQRSLVTFFQPIVPCGSPRQVFAYECLVRGRHAHGELIYPNKLYDAARATGMLPQLDREARRTAIETSAQRRLESHIFINFNPRSLDNSLHGLDDTLAAARQSGIRSNRFVFEVVESDEIEDFDHLLRILDFYRQAGFQVALDDLGAGYSSLKLLARIKPDFVKLDMDLIRDVDRDPYKSQVASKLLELARELGVSSVVEGVETEGQWQWALEHGADYAQGYFFARPDAVPWTFSESAVGPPARLASPTPVKTM